MESVGCYKKKFLWGVVNDHILEEPTDHEEIGLREFDFNYFGEDDKGVVREGSSDFPYLLMLIKILPSNWETHLNKMNHNMDEENGKALVKGNVRYRKVCRFSRNEFWKNIS